MRDEIGPFQVWRILLALALTDGRDRSGLPNLRFHDWSHEMRDIDIIMKAMHDAQALLGTYIEPGPRDPEAVLQSMLEIVDREDVIAAQDRLSKGYGRLKVVQ